MENHFLNTNDTLTDTTRDVAFNEEDFFKFIHEQGYSPRQVKNLKRGLNNLKSFKPLHSIIPNLSSRYSVKKIREELRKAYTTDNAKVALTTTYRIRDYLLHHNLIEQSLKYRTTGFFLRPEKALLRYIYEERKFGKIYGDRLQKIYKDLTDHFISISLVDFSEVDQVLIFKYFTLLSHSKTRLSNLRVLLRFLYREGYLQHDYSEIILSVKSRDNEVRKFLSVDNIEKLLGAVDRETITGKQNYLFFLLMARYGLRAVEILKLRLEDIEWDKSQIYVFGKHANETYFPLCQEIGEALIDYLTHSDRGTDEHIFTTIRPPFKKLTRSKRFNAALHAMYKKSGVTPPTKKIHLNVFRHSLATNKLNAGSSMRQVKTLMRHENLETTMVYAKYNLPSLTHLSTEWPGE